MMESLDCAGKKNAKSLRGKTERLTELVDIVQQMRKVRSYGQLPFTGRN